MAYSDIELISNMFLFLSKVIIQLKYIPECGFCNTSYLDLQSKITSKCHMPKSDQRHIGEHVNTRVPEGS